MALFDIKYYSTVLNTQVDLRVYMPTPENDPVCKDVPYYDRSKRFQVLYLLHGNTGDCTVWTRYTNIERYAREHHLAVVCASVGNTFYVNTTYGAKYLTFMTEELPTFIGRMFPISEKREDTFIVGTSMGGFGAYRIALEQPERFCAVASLSGTLDMISMAKMYNNDETGAFDDIFKREDLRPGSQHDLMALVTKHIQEGRQLPKFYQCCGTDDSMYGLYASFRDRFKELDVDFTCDEDPGVHNWAYWDKVIPKVLEWLPLANALVEG